MGIEPHTPDLRTIPPYTTTLVQDGGSGYIFVADPTGFEIGARANLVSDTQPTVTYIIIQVNVERAIIWLSTALGDTNSDLSVYTVADNASITVYQQQIVNSSTPINIADQSTIVVADVTPANPSPTDYLPVRLTDGTMFYKASGGGSGGTVDQGAPNTINFAWPIKITNGTNIAGVTVGGALKIDGSATTQPISGSVSVNNFPAIQPVSGTISALQSGTWTVQPGNTANTTPWLTTINQGGNSAVVTGANALKVDGSAVTQPISGTVGVTQSTTPWVVGSNNFVDTNNSSTTPLGSNGVFTGTATNVLGYSQVAIQVFADKNSASSGLSIQFSSDGTNWDFSDNETVTANTTFNIAIGVKAQFFRIVYTNTNSAQSIFRLSTIIKASASNGIVQNVDNAPISGDEVLLTKAVISGKTTGGGGGYVDVKVNPSGTLTVDASGSSVNQSGTWNINNITGTVSLPTGAATSVNQTTLGSQTTKINDGTNTATVTGANALKVDGSGVTQPISGTVSAQPTLPTVPRLSSVPISLTTVSGDQTLVAGIGGQTIRIFKLFLVFSASTLATFKDGASTPFDGSLAMLSSGSIVLDLDTEPWFVTSVGNDFILNLGSTTSVGGRVYYLQS